MVEKVDSRSGPNKDEANRYLHNLVYGDIDPSSAAVTRPMLPQDGIASFARASVSRDRRGRVVWKTPGNEPMSNLRLGMTNVRGLLLLEVPEIEGMPLDSDQHLELSQRPFLESLLLERANASKAFKRAVVTSNRGIAYPPGYSQFNTSWRFALAASFSEWGLFADELKRFGESTKQLKEARTRLDQDVPDYINVTLPDQSVRVVKPINQVSGREALIKLANGEIRPSEASPIYVTDLRKRKHDPSVTFHVGRGFSDITLDEEVATAYEKLGAMLLVPMEDERFGYRWIDIYGIDQNKKEAANIVGSIRINTDQRKLESNGWYGPEQQAFFDCATGLLKIEDPNDLPSFVVKTPKGGSIYFGRAGNRYITTTFHEETQSEELTIVPRYNKELGYLWIDGYELGKSSGKPLFTRRVITDKEAAKIIDWKGLGMQSLIDWIYGRIPTSKVGEVQAEIDPNIRNSNLYFGEPSLVLQLVGGTFDRSKPAFLVAKEKGIYKWLEIQQDGTDGKRQLITKVRATINGGKPKLLGDWIGPEKQALYDYLDDKVDTSQLGIIRASLDSNKVAHIVRYKDKELTVVLRTVAFSVGDIVSFKPIIDESGNFTLEVTKDDNPDVVLARSVLNREEGKFKTTSLEPALSKSRKPLGYWTEERIRETAIQIRDKHDCLTTKSIQAEIPSFLAIVTGKYPGGLVGLRQDLGMGQADQIDQHTTQEANEYLRDLVFGEEKI